MLHHRDCRRFLADTQHHAAGKPVTTATGVALQGGMGASASYNDGQPVKIRIADKVGDILVMGSAKDANLQPFEFYI